jgi:hypothetical protein
MTDRQIDRQNDLQTEGPVFRVGEPDEEQDRALYRGVVFMGYVRLIGGHGLDELIALLNAPRVVRAPLDKLVELVLELQHHVITRDQFAAKLREIVPGLEVEG